MASDISRRRKMAAQDQSALYKDRRSALMAAAADTFREQGLDGASLNDIAQRAGLDRATLYYYVESKEELYRAVVEEVVHDNVAQVQAVKSGPGTGAEKVREMIRLLMKSYAENYPHLYIFVAEDFGRRGPVRRQGRKSTKVTESQDWRMNLSSLGDIYHSAVSDIIVEGFEDGSLSSNLSPGVVAHGIIGMVSWTHRWFKPGGPSNAEEVADGFATMVLQGLAPKATRGRGRTSRNA
jgi:TetR/AcrR family transcriptional regulator, cholesterol catabolism regulator